MHRNGVDVERADLPSVLRHSFGGRVHRQTRNQAVLRAAEIRHAGRTVVDDEMAGLAVGKLAEGRQTGVAGGKAGQIGGRAKRRQPRHVGWIMQAVMGESPTGE